MPVVPGSVYEHYKGGLYQVVLTDVIDTGFADETRRLVIYKNAAGATFAREVSEFLGVVGEGSNRRLRFTPAPDRWPGFPVSGR